MGVLHALVVAAPSRLDTLLGIVLAVLQNAAPYFTHLSMFASVKLMNLFELLTDLRFLFRAEKNHEHCATLLNIFTSVLCHQYQGNENLVYALIVREHLFTKLLNLPQTFAAAKARKKKNKLKEKAQEVKSSKGVAKAQEEAATEASQETSQSAANEDKQVEKVGKVENGTKTKTNPNPPVALGPGKFRISSKWIQSWHSQLPLQVIFAATKYLKLKITQKSEIQVLHEADIIQFVGQMTLVGVVKAPELVTRHYVANAFTDLWFSTYLWGMVFLRNIDTNIVRPDKIQLFSFSSQAQRQVKDYRARTQGKATPVGNTQ